MWSGRPRGSVPVRQVLDGQALTTGPFGQDWRPALPTQQGRDRPLLRGGSRAGPRILRPEGNGVPATFVNDLVESGLVAERPPSRPAHQRAKALVVRGLELRRRCPLGNVDEKEKARPA